MPHIRIGVAAGLVAGAAAAALPGVRLLALSLGNGQVWSLIGGLAIGAGVAVLLALGTAAALTEVKHRRIVHSILILAAETGLTWLALDFAARHRTGQTWITGVLALVVSGLVIVIWLVDDAKLDEDTTDGSPVFAVAEISLGLLSVHFAGNHQFIVAWVLASIAIVESAAWMALPEAVALRPPARLKWIKATLPASLGVVPVAGTISAVVIFALAGNATAASVTGGLGVAVGVFLLIRFDLLEWPDLDLSWAGREGPPPPGTAIPAAARVGGLIVPLGTTIWVAVTHLHSTGTTAVHFLGEAAAFIAVAITLLILQGLVTNYLRPVSYTGTLAIVGEAAQTRTERRSARDGGPESYPRERYASRAERTALKSSSSIVQRIVRPIAISPSALKAGISLASSTGLSVDHAWLNLQLVVPPDVRGELERRERIVAVLRVAAASALCTAIAWPLGALFLGGGAPGGVLAILALVPLACMTVAIVVARTRLTDAYLRRVRATDMYRFDLVKAMHLPLPQDGTEFTSLARYMNSASVDSGLSSRPITWTDGMPAGPGMNLEEIRQSLATEVTTRTTERIESLLRAEREALHLENTRVLAEQRALFRDWLTQQAVGEEELTLLAEQIAERAAGPVGKELAQRLTAIQQRFDQELRASMRNVVDESLAGPSLTNFIGYVTLELHRSSEEHPLVGASGGMVRTGPGHELALDLSVVRNKNAARVSALSRGPSDSFLVLEPFVIEGGRDAGVAQFDMVADCATLTPLPRRHSLTVAERASTPFRFKLPGQEGRHELWFQLYQAGRLIQVMSIAVEVGPVGTAAE